MEDQMKVYTVAEVNPDGSIGMIHGERGTRQRAVRLCDEQRLLCPRITFDVWEYSIKRLFV